MGMGMVPELHPDVRGVWKKFQMTNFTMPNILSSIKYALKSFPGLADVGDPHGDGDGPRVQIKKLPPPRSSASKNEGDRLVKGHLKAKLAKGYIAIRPFLYR